MLHYYEPFNYDSLIISIDNVVVDFWISNPNYRDIIEARINSLYGDGVTIVEWTSKKPGTFQEQYLFRLHEGTSFWLGHGLVGKGIEINRYRLEANPNKVATNRIFQEINELLIAYARRPLSRITRFDLAVDFPVDRSKCFLVKDRRLYIERRHGVEYTQYLGSKSSAVGRVKLYNKTAEAKLDYPLTRLELTLDPAIPYDEVNFPKVYFLKPDTTAGAGVRITDTERFIVSALLQGYGTLNDLGRKTRAKIEMLMQNYVESVHITSEMYDKVLDRLSIFKGMSRECEREY